MSDLPGGFSPDLAVPLPSDTGSLSVNPGSPRSLPAPVSPIIDEHHNGPVPSSPSTSLTSDDPKDALSLGPAIEDDDEKRPLRFIIDPPGPLTHDFTTVDVVTVPCPGGHPLRSWSRAGLLSRYFGAPAMRDTEGQAAASSNSSEASSEKPGVSWVRQGIRKEANRARILLYEHPDISPDGAQTLSGLADALLEELVRVRGADGESGRERPLLFVAHSIGGIVVKMALVKASRNVKFQRLLSACYGVSFFGTPHQGSTYFAMQSLSASITELLQLSAPLPSSITDDLRVGNSVLLHVDADFKDIAHDMKVWTFYETIDSRLGTGDVYFAAPLSSIKSAILGMRQERIFPLQSDHANVASFGRHNAHTLRLFLKQLAVQIEQADDNYSGGDAPQWTLNLEQKVNIEVHGFFEDPIDHELVDTAIRAWSTRLPLKDFLKKGPEVCLTERLNEVEEAPDEARFLQKRGRTTRQTYHDPSRAVNRGSFLNRNALGITGQIVTQMSPPGSPIIRPIGSRSPRTESAPAGSPIAGVIQSTSPPSYRSTPIKKPSPLIRADFDQDLAVDRLSPPLRPQIGRSISRSFSDGSRLEYRDFPPFSQRSRSTIGSPDEDKTGMFSQLPDSVVALRKRAKNQKDEADEKVIMDEMPTAFFKPDAKSRKFIWVHLPYNNPTWVKNIFETLQVCYKRDFSPLYSHEFWQTRHTRGRHSQHYAYFAKPGCYFTAPRTMSPRRSSAGQNSLSPVSADEGMYTCLFLPYLHFDSYKRLIRRRDLILKRIQNGRARPIPDAVAKSDSLELQVIWEYLDHDPPINCRRTIDQYGYPSIRDTRSRDDDQMLYKLTKERVCVPEEKRGFYRQGSSGRDGASDGSSSWKDGLTGRVKVQNESEPEDKVLNGNVLMVDQLWLWVINTQTVLSFFPKRESDPIEGPLYGQADLRDSIFNEVNVDLTRQCDNALDLAALSVLHAVSVFIDKSSHPDLEVFRIFEEAISILTEKLTFSLKAFRREGFRDKALAYDAVENKAHSIRARHKEEGIRAEQENRDNTSALLELRDIEDELVILLHLFDRQSKVLSSMHNIYSRPELKDQTANGRLFLAEASKRVAEYAHTADEMIRRVRGTRDEYDKLLQMVQRQAQVDEVRLSRLHADLASAQSRSVMIFTTFTVIFLPLSFFTSLFGMNTREWGGGDNLPLRTIGAVALPASLALVTASLLIAWSTNVRTFFRGLGHLWRRVMRWLHRVVWLPSARVIDRGLELARQVQWRRHGSDGEGSQRSGEGGEDVSYAGQKSRGKATLVKETSDFWERHRPERDRGYQIPEVNTKGRGGRWEKRA